MSQTFDSSCTKNLPNDNKAWPRAGLLIHLSNSKNDDGMEAELTSLENVAFSSHIKTEAHKEIQSKEFLLMQI